MSKINILQLRIIYVGLLLFISTILVYGQSTNPNILLITSDQLIPDMMGAYGNKVVKTPNLDKLARSGVLFNAAYTPNPICAPARACMMTGRYSTNIGVWDNAAPLGSDIPTICHYLESLNYESVLSGKMHFVGPDQLHGYDKRLIPNIYPTDFQWTKNRFEKEPRSHGLAYQGENIRIVPEGIDLEKKSGKLQFIRPSYDFEERKAVGSGFNEESNNSRFDKWAHFKAIDYLNEKRERIKNGDKEPFFLTLSYNYPHEPFFPPAELYELYKNAPVDLPVVRNETSEIYSIMDQWLNTHHGLNGLDMLEPESVYKVRRAYYALVHYVDLMIGEIIEALDENGFNENTIIIFTSDHGDMLLKRGMVQKRVFYEWSSRVPMIIKYPDNRFAGKHVNTPVSLIDVLPTILDYAGVPESSRSTIDGQSMVPLIEQGEEDRYIISEMHSEGVYAPCFMIRQGKFKYTYIHGYGGQLFDLDSDPDELNNLIGNRRHTQLIAELRGKIFTHFDPEQIESRLHQSLKDRMIIQQSINKNGNIWNYEVEFQE